MRDEIKAVGGTLLVGTGSASIAQYHYILGSVLLISGVILFLEGVHEE